LRPNEIAVTFIPAIFKVVDCLCVTEAPMGLMVQDSECCSLLLQQECDSCSVLRDDCELKLVQNGVGHF